MIWSAMTRHRFLFQISLSTIAYIPFVMPQ